MEIEDAGKLCTVVLHDDTVPREDVLCGASVLAAGCKGYLVAPGAKALCIEAGGAAQNADEVSVHTSLAKVFGFENRMKATIQPLEDAEAATASHVELLFRDQHLSRADMWRLKAQVDGSVLYQGQRLDYLGSTAASVEAIYIAGQQVDSAFAANPQTRLIFRSGSARYTILVQVSQELLEYWSGGDLLYERLLYGFLPELFRRWDELKVRHQVTVVLFGRRLRSTTYDGDVTTATQDFYHVVVSDMPSSLWRDLIRRLKIAFNDAKLPRQVSLAATGNMLEAVHVTAMDFAGEKIDPHLSSTGTSIIVITAGSGLFEAEQILLKRTTEVLMGNSIGVDIVSVAPRPLHPVPLFQYRRGEDLEYALPHWVDISYWQARDGDFNPKWLLPDDVGHVDKVAIPRLQHVSNTTEPSTADSMEAIDEQMFDSSKSADVQDLKPAPNLVAAKTKTKRSLDMSQEALPEPADSEESLVPLSTSAANVPSITRAKRESLPPHSLMQMSRKISVGPRGLALSSGVASTTVSAEHAQLGREPAVSPTPAPRDTTSGLAKQIRDSLKKKPSQQSIVSRPAPALSPASKPIVIQPKGRDSTEDVEDPASLIEKAVVRQPSLADQGSSSLSATPKARDGSLPVPGRGSISDESDFRSPWLTLLNPCNPRRDNMRVATEYRQWQNVFPNAVSSGTFKWDSMCTPAILPLMTESRVSLTDLERRFKKKVRRLLTSNGDAHHVMLQMIALRLAEGCQLVPTRKLPHAQMPSEHIERTLLSFGSRYHELRCLSNAEVQVSEYEREQKDDPPPGDVVSALDQYRAWVKPPASIRELAAVIHLRSGRPIADWSHFDDQCANPFALSDSYGVSRMRLVLIPVDFVRSETHISAQARELSDEERRLDGIQRLTQLWQRHRYFADEDERHHASMVKPKGVSTVERDPNPLAIEYQTRDPSAVVITLGVNTTDQSTNGQTSASLFAESELYHTSNFDIVKLVRHMQEVPPSGIEVKDRRWFTRLHLKCFRGDEMTNWLLRVFKDLQTREDAVALGNQLMDEDIFDHVRGKHEFRDGNYFYQIKSAHRTTDYPDTAGFFGRAIGRSVPSTPISEMRQSPITLPAYNLTDSPGKNSNSSPTVPTSHPQERKEVLLSQLLQYNVDLAKKSSRLEIINLHYDRIHNPENCYHIQLDWTGTTPRMIRESIVRWTSLVEGHGLRLVQLPTTEACRLHEQQPLDQVIPVKFAIRPPNAILATPQLDPHSFSPRPKADPNGYHKALLRKMDFVLDYEAASSFPRKVDVRYSWGRPDYMLTQYVHKSGTLLAQISNNGKSDILLLPNRLAPSPTPAVGKRMETIPVEKIVQSVRSFCRDGKALKPFFEELRQPEAIVASPLARTDLGPDADVPPIELPAHLLHLVHRQSGVSERPTTPTQLK